MGHHHHHQGDANKRMLLVSFLNVFITIAELIGGVLANSLALLSDAIHNLSDTLAILLAYIAGRVSRRRSNAKKTFGYKRIEILAAFINASVLIVISVFLIYEAGQRFFDPQPIKGLLMMVVATAGLLFNLLSVLLLRKYSGENLNIRSAYLHLLGDTLSSVAVVIGGMLIYFFNIYWVDPLVTVLISLYLIKETWDVFRQSANILMQAAPEGLDIELIIPALEKIPGIRNIHHVHIWGMSEKDFHFECHADLEEDLTVSRTNTIKKQMEKKLLEEFHIGHLTVQFEYGVPDDKDIIHDI